MSRRTGTTAAPHETHTSLTSLSEGPTNIFQDQGPQDQTPKDEPGIRIRKLVFVDGERQRTTLDLVTGEMHSQAMNRTGFVQVSGEGDVAMLDFSNAYFWGNLTLEFDPPHDTHPFQIALSTEDADGAEDVESVEDDDGSDG